MMQPGALSIISAGSRNIYGHPHGQVTDFIETTNGRNHWFQSDERKMVEMRIETT
jgi:beta-lactamase superfamily II metal-dependent hydrolase